MSNDLKKSGGESERGKEEKKRKKKKKENHSGIIKGGKQNLNQIAPEKLSYMMIHFFFLTS